MRFRNRCSG